jgi:hypothetical protein
MFNVLLLIFCHVLPCRMHDVMIDNVSMMAIDEQNRRTDGRFRLRRHRSRFRIRCCHKQQKFQTATVSTVSARYPVAFRLAFIVDTLSVVKVYLWVLFPAEKLQEDPRNTLVEPCNCAVPLTPPLCCLP